MTENLLTPAQQRNAIKTWRYLRVALVVLVLGLGASILHEFADTGWKCLQHSISAYYYTPVRGLFVGGLMAIGVCLVVLKGNTPEEDVCLNLAGALAPVVAFVPTTTHANCGALGVVGIPKHIDNNVFALLLIGAVGIVIAAVLVRRDPTIPDGPTEPAGLGLWTAFGLWLLAAVTFYGPGETVFRENAHHVAAITMFVFIFLVVVLNARGIGGTPLRNRYGVIASLMFGSAVVIGLLAWLAHWEHWVFVIEAAMIGFFVWFWIVQTAELWKKGLR